MSGRSLHREFAAPPPPVSSDVQAAQRQVHAQVQAFVREQLSRQKGCETTEIVQEDVRASDDGQQLRYLLRGVRELYTRYFVMLADEHGLVWLDHMYQNAWTSSGQPGMGRQLQHEHYLIADVGLFMARERALGAGDQTWRRDLLVAVVFAFVCVLALLMLVVHWSDRDDAASDYLAWAFGSWRTRQPVYEHPAPYSTESGWHLPNE